MLKTVCNSQVKLNALSSYAGLGSNVLVGLITIPLIVSFLEPEEIGVWAIVNSVMVCIIWLDLGVGYSTGRLIANSIVKKDIEETNSWYSLSTVILSIQGVVIFFVGWSVAPLIIDFFNIPENLVNEANLLIIVTAFIIGAKRPIAIYSGILTAMDKYHCVPLGIAARAWIRLGILAICLWAGLRLKSYIVAELLAAVFELIYYKSTTRKCGLLLKFQYKSLAWKKCSRLFSLSSSLSIVALSDTVMAMLPVFLVGRVLGVSTVPVITYTGKIAETLRAIMGKTTESFYPSMQAAYIKGEKKKALNIQGKSVNVVLLFAAVGGALVLAINRPVVSLLAGSEFYGGSTLTLVILLYSLVTVIVNAAVKMLIAAANMRLLWLMSILSVLLSIGFGYWALRYYGVNELYVVCIVTICLCKGLYVCIEGCRLWGVPWSFFLKKHSLRFTFAALSLMISAWVIKIVPAGQSLWPTLTELGVMVFTIATVLIVYRIPQKVREVMVQRR